jgi:hypothetical protein
MPGKCSILDNWSVFCVPLCVVCFIVLTMRRLWSTQMTIGGAHYTSYYIDSSSRCALGILGIFFFFFLMPLWLFFYVFYVFLCGTPNLVRHALALITLVPRFLHKFMFGFLIVTMSITTLLRTFHSTSWLHDEGNESNDLVGRKVPPILERGPCEKLKC